MPRMGNANFKREKVRSEREILDRLFPNWGVYNSNKPCLLKRRNIETNVLESESDRDSLGGCTSSDESTSMSHRRLDHPQSENESGNNSDSAIDPGSSSDSEKTSDDHLSSLSETISRISISSNDSAIDDKVSQKYPYKIAHSGPRNVKNRIQRYQIRGSSTKFTAMGESRRPFLKVNRLRGFKRLKLDGLRFVAYESRRFR